MNMSRQYPGPYYHLFGPRSQDFGPPNQQFRPPFPPYFPRDYNPMYPPSFPPPQSFPEYSLWGDSSYNRTDLIPPNCMFGNPNVPSFQPVQFQQSFPNPECVPPDKPPESLPPDSLPPESIPPESIPPESTPPEAPDPEEPEAMSSLDIVDDDEAIEGSSEPELTGLEELEKLVIDKEDLYRCSDSEDSDVQGVSDDNPDTDQGSNSSGSSDWTNTNFMRASYPSAYPWASRPARVVNNRGRKSNIMQRRLVRALSQPVKFDKGASMMQRMGWMGGGLGRDGSGIVDPIQPNANYATSSVGFGQLTFKKPKKAEKTKKNGKNKPKLQPHQIKKKKRELFMTNILELLLKFVKNDLILEMYFDTKLHNGERKRIHRVVSALSSTEDFENITTNRQQEYINEIHRLNKYILSSQSDGDGSKRQICVFKSAPSHMFLVTPDDCRPCITEIKEMEEENPFMKSITKHIRPDSGTVLQPRAPHLFDKLAQFFIEYCADDTFTEFRFLGPFTRREVYVMNNFFNLISDLALKRKPLFRVPLELLEVFALPDLRFHAESAPNGFTAISKEPFSLKSEFEKQEEEARKKRELDHHPANLLARKILFSKIT